MPIITEMYAFCAEEKPGDEGVIGFIAPAGNWVPLVGADMTRVEELREIACAVRDEIGYRVKLKKFKLVSEEDL